MSILIPRQRVVKPVDGDVTPIAWPAHVEIRAVLTPSDFFGAPDAPLRPRTVFTRGDKSSQVLMNANEGILELVSSQRLEPLNFGCDFGKAAKVDFVGTEVRITHDVESQSEFLGLLEFVQLVLPSSLSLSVGRYVGVAAITGVINGTREFRCEMQTFHGSFEYLDANERWRLVAEAMDLAGLRDAAHVRFLYASLYFQQAVRLMSPSEVRVVGSYVGEALLNLAKAIGVLFGEKREVVRSRCRELGYTDADIESQVIPILLIRNNVDVGHPVIGRVPEKLVVALRRFSDRAVQNVHRLLRTTAEKLRAGRLKLDDYELVRPENAPEMRLLQRLTEYADSPPLSEPSDWRTKPDDARYFVIAPSPGPAATGPNSVASDPRNEGAPSGQE